MLRKLKIKTKLAILVAIPTIAIVILSAVIALKGDDLVYAIFGGVLTVITLCVGYFTQKNILTSLNTFESNLMDFLKYVNKETINVVSFDDSSDDELGKISKYINNTISPKIQKDNQQDLGVIGEILSFSDKLATGDFSARIYLKSPNAYMNYFINSLNNLGEVLSKNSSNIVRTIDEFANYKYTSTLSTEGLKSDLLSLAISVNTVGSAINEMLIENKSNGLTLDRSSGILLENVDTLHKNSGEAAASLEETSAALEEITSTFRGSTENIIKMSESTSSLVDASKQGESLVTQTTASMDELNTQVSAINEAITVIDQIAFQTNILSLNAAVEAATAGEAGKGFAVVAQEVRSLANRSAEAASQIKDLVESANQQAIDGKKIADSMISGYTGLNENIGKTIDLISDTETASKEILMGIEQINSAVNILDRKTQENDILVNSANDVAVQTGKIAKLIVTNADEKEFIGKNDVTAKEV